MTVNSVQTTNKNTCPHGMPQGSCPICNGMMSGGGRASRADNAKSKNEWSWMKCYIEGQMMRGREARHEEQVKLSTSPIEAQAGALKSIMSFTSNVKSMLNSVYNVLPSSVQNVFAKITNSILSPLNNLISNISNMANKIAEFAKEIKGLIMATAEKLAAIFGELKNFIDRNIIDKLKRLTKKMLRIFIWEKDEEHLEIDEELEKFKARELKKIRKAVLYFNKKERNK